MRASRSTCAERPAGRRSPRIWCSQIDKAGSRALDSISTHTFDANAALRLDWLTVPGVGSEQADQLMADAPYQSLQALLDSPALSPPLGSRVAAMSAAMSRIDTHTQSDEEAMSLSTIARGYLWRLAAIVLIATVTGTGFARLAGVRRSWTAALIALTATTLVIVMAWIISSPAWYPMAAPVILGGAPWAMFRLVRGQGVASAARALAAWLVASTPSLLLAIPW